MTNPPTESYILCEGYHDRAFWTGILTHLGCTDPGARPGGTRIPVLDPWGLGVRGSGEHAFQSRSDRFVRIVPAGGKANINKFLRNRLDLHSQKPLRYLVVNVDSDINADGTPAQSAELTRAGVETLIRSIDPSAASAESGGIHINRGSATVFVARWHTDDPPTSGVPNQNTLERIICAAVVGAHPDRADPVHKWLESRPDAPSAGPKEHAWSYLAGWYADSGSYEAFCQRIWQSPEIVAQLKPRLEAAGIWRVAETLAN